MLVDRFDFDLPSECIALRPVSPRDAARLLVINHQHSGQLQDSHVHQLVQFLRPGDALVFNNTRVIPAQLEGFRSRIVDGSHQQAKISITLHMRLAPDRWLGFARGAKKLANGDRLCFANQKSTAKAGQKSTELTGSIVSKNTDGEVEIKFDVGGSGLDEALANVGLIPLPPYISSRRAVDARDKNDYQTIYARHDGAVAAPTAGLHFTDDVIAQLADRQISCHFVTLHVGAGTFLPVKVADTDQHKMHFERGEVTQQTADALNKIRASGGRIVSVGTTSLRLLETATNAKGQIQAWSGATDIFITPGYQFRAIDILLTNFHLPRSTLFMLVSAFAGIETMQQAYQHAIDGQYRFYSYGDASLLFPAAR